MEQPAAITSPGVAARAADPCPGDRGAGHCGLAADPVGPIDGGLVGSKGGAAAGLSALALAALAVAGIL
jgi:hypothetical protein